MSPVKRSKTTFLLIDLRRSKMSDEEWEKLLEEEAMYLELEWTEWLDEQAYDDETYYVCRDS